MRILILLSFCLALASCSNRSDLTIFNNTNYQISNLIVGLKRFNEFKIDKIAPKLDTTLFFTKFSDSHYIIKGNINDSIIINDSLGYVTNGMDFKDTIIINLDSANKPILTLRTKCNSIY